MKKIKRSILQYFKYFLTVFGAWTSPNRLHQIQMVVNYMRIGRWMPQNNFDVKKRLPDRYGVFSVVAEKVQDKQVLYLEFGVFEGISMRFWSKALRHPKSILHGFDSFEGLPEDWDVVGGVGKGAFDVGGKIPQIDDTRVQFFKGWFDQVLPGYKMPAHETLVIVIDADLFSSTAYVLNYLRPYIKPGDFIYFDDMCRPDHEPKAFSDFIHESGLKFQLVAVDYSLTNAFFECVS